MHITMPHTEELHARIQEIALRSAYGHGKTLRDFSFSLPRPDDVLTLPHHALALRMDTKDTGYSEDEEASFSFLMPTMQVFSLPTSFLALQETLDTSHRADLEEIARGLIREHHIPEQSTFHAFSHHAYAAHQAFLVLVHDLLHIDRPLFAKHLLHHAHNDFLAERDALFLSTRRLDYPPLFDVLSHGLHDQYMHFLNIGHTLGFEDAFFSAQLMNIPPCPF